jgi:ankyrin repeat protein
MLRIIPILFLIILLKTSASAQNPDVRLPPPETNKQSETVPATDDESDLIERVKEGELAEVLRLLEKGVSPNAKDGNRSPALHWAVRKNRTDIVEALLARKARVDEEDENDGTALQVAASAGRADLLKLLIAHGADVNHPDKNGHTALMCAVFGAAIKSAPAWLASSFFELDEDDALLTMIGSEHLAAAKLLLDAGANVNAQGKDCGLTALMIAALHGNVELAKTLLEYRADVKLTNGKFAALQFAVALNSPQELKEELDHLPDNESRQAFLNWVHLTAPGRQAVVTMLRKAGAK